MMTATMQTKLYITFGILLTVFGVVWAFVGDTSNVKFVTVEGISVFAALYVIAQASERVTEWVVDLLSLSEKSPEKRKEEALRDVRAANSTLNGNPTLADLSATSAAETKKEAGETKVAEARRDITFLAHGVSIAASALAVNALNYGLLTHIGAEGVSAGIDRLFTVLAAAGGTKALHELIGRLQKAKEAAETGAK